MDQLLALCDFNPVLSQLSHPSPASLLRMVCDLLPCLVANTRGELALGVVGIFPKALSIVGPPAVT
jgi:hypothetical protein